MQILCRHESGSDKRREAEKELSALNVAVYK